jgi:glycopeptide antibiotics resistance protein
MIDGSRVPGDPRLPDEVEVRAVYALAAVAFAAFAVWGSLFPLTFQHVDIALVRASFWAAWGGGPLTWSRSDFASNVLLFLPIGFFAAAAVDGRPGRPRPTAAWLALLGGAVLLSAALEIAQGFVPWRTSSIVDVLAEAIGTAIGMAIRSAAYRPCDRCAVAAYAAVERASPLERALLLYCAGFAIAWLLPLDVTIRPGEIADKFVHKRLLLPFSPSPDAASVRQLGATLIAAIPLGVAAGICGARRSVVRALAVALPAVCVLELMQVFVFSRTTDGTLLLPMSGGILAGAIFAAR